MGGAQGTSGWQDCAQEGQAFHSFTERKAAGVGPLGSDPTDMFGVCFLAWTLQPPGWAWGKGSPMLPPALSSESSAWVRAAPSLLSALAARLLLYKYHLF